MRLLISAIAMFLLATLPGTSKADDGVTIGEMAEHCQKPDGDFFKMYCYTYVAAVIDVQTIYSLADATGPQRVCFPPPVVARQASAVFVQWAAHHPASHHRPAAAGIVESMTNAFPCSDR